VVMDHEAVPRQFKPFVKIRLDNLFLHQHVHNHLRRKYGLSVLTLSSSNATLCDGDG
jgi:hypothetical protein